MSDLWHVFVWRRPTHVHLLHLCIRRMYVTEKRRRWFIRSARSEHLGIRP